jgi:phosphatidylcholine synthase
LAAGAVILLTSLYHFCNTGIKTSDQYFEGFPAIWNVVAFYLYILPLPPAAIFALVLVLSALTLVPIRCVHPFRVRHWRPITASLTVLGMVVNAVILWRLPERDPVLIGLSLVAPAYLLVISVRRTLRGGPDADARHFPSGVPQS